MRHKRKISILVACLMLFSLGSNLLATPAGAQPAGTVSLSGLPVGDLEPGSPVSVVVEIAGGVDVFGASIDLTLDPAYFDITAPVISGAGFFEEVGIVGPEDVFIMPDFITDAYEPGFYGMKTVSYLEMRTGQTVPGKGTTASPASGTLFVFNLRPLAATAQATPIKVVVKLSDSDAQPIGAEFVFTGSYNISDGQVTIPMPIIATPAEHDVLQEADVTFSGSGNDLYLVELEIMGPAGSQTVSSIAVSSGTWSTAVSGLGDGPYAVRARHYQGTDYGPWTPPLPFMVDTLPPIVAIDPTVPTQVDTAMLLVTGTFVEANLQAIYVVANPPVGYVGMPSDLAIIGPGVFHHMVTLNEGSNDVLVLAVDMAGRTAIATLDVNYTTGVAIPVPMITSPGPMQSTNSPTPAFAGFGDSDYMIQLEVGPIIQSDIAVVGTNWFWQPAAPGLVDGVYTVRARHYQGSDYGNWSTAITFTVDTQPPVVNIDAVPGIVATPSLTVTGTIVEPNLNAAFVRVNPPIPYMGDPADVVYVVDGVFSKNVTLASGQNTILVMAIDTAGNSAVAQVEVTYQVETPVLSYITVLPATAQLAPGQHQAFTATGYTSAHVAIPGLVFDWSVSDPSIGSVTPAGVFTASSTNAGTANVIAESGGIQGQATVTVSEMPMLKLVPSSTNVGVASTFTVDVVLENAQDVIGADFQLSFPTDKLQVVDADAYQGGIQITPGSFIAGQIGANTADNTEGTVRFAVAKAAPGVNGTGTLATVTFTTLAEGEAVIEFLKISQVPQTELLDSNFDEVDHGVLDTSVTVISGGTITGQILPQGRGSSARAGATVKIVGQPIETTTAPNGTYTLTGVPATGATETYRLLVRFPTYLAYVIENVTVEAGQTTTVPSVTLLAGDANGDNRVSLVDLAILAQTYGLYSTDVGYDARADFNGDNRISLVDLALLAGNYGVRGADIPAGE